MMRLCIVLATALVMSIASDALSAKTAMQTFPVLAGAGAHDVYPASDGTQSGLPRNPPANSAISIPGPAGRI